MPIHSLREALRSRRVGTSIPPKDERAGIVTTSDGPGEWGEGSEGEKPRKASTVGVPSRDADDSTDSSREEGPGGGRSRSTLLREGWGGRQRQEGRDPERGTARARGERLGGRSPRTLRRYARREGQWWRSRWG
jgi:hypothetical protein